VLKTGHQLDDATIRSRYERLGLKLIALKMLVPTPAQVEEHYTLDPNWRRVTGEKTIASYRSRNLAPPSEDPLEITAKILKNLKKYLTAGPIIAMVWEGAHAVELVRKITGATEPRSSPVGKYNHSYAGLPAVASPSLVVVNRPDNCVCVDRAHVIYQPE